MVSVFTPRLLQNRKVTNIEQAVLGKTWSRERGTSENLMFDFIAPLPFVDKTLSYSHTLIALKNDSNPVKKKHNAPSGKELSSYFLYIYAQSMVALVLLLDSLPGRLIRIKWNHICLGRCILIESKRGEGGAKVVLQKRNKYNPACG